MQETFEKLPKQTEEIEGGCVNEFASEELRYKNNIRYRKICHISEWMQDTRLKREQKFLILLQPFFGLVI